MSSSRPLDAAVTRVFDALEALESHPEATSIEHNAAAICHMAMEPVLARVNSRILGYRLVGATDKIAYILAKLSRGTCFGGRA